MPCANCTCQGNPTGCTSRLPAVGASVSLRPNRKQGSTTTEGERTKLWDTTTSTGGESEGSSSRASKGKSYGAIEGAPTGSSTPSESDPLLSSPSMPASVISKCEKHNGARGVCCRDVKQAQETPNLINPDVVRDVIIGLSDGLTVPFALTAGLSGVGSTRIVVLAGLAELVSGAISMGVGGLLSAQAELSHYNYMQSSTQQRVQISCSGELEREVCEILEPFGVPAEVGALVAAKLQSVERLEREENETAAENDGVEALPAPVTAQTPSARPPPPPVRRSDGLIGPERGLTPFLLRMGQGLEKIEESRVWQSALVIGASYFIGGFIPLLPYILLNSIEKALLCSILITGIVLLLFGVVKQKCTGGQSDARGLAWGALSTLFVGAAAAGSSWIIVRALEGGSA